MPETRMGNHSGMENHKNKWCTGKAYSFAGIPEFSEGYQQYHKRTGIINNTKGKQRTLINEGDMMDVTKEMRVILTLPGKSDFCIVST